MRSFPHFAAHGVPPWLVGWLDAVSLWQALLVVGGIFAAVAFIRSKGWRWIVSFARAILATAAVIDNVKELPAFIIRTDETHRAIQQTLADQDLKIDEIHHEVNYNDGSSVKDAVDRVERGVKGLYDRVADLAETDVRLAAADEQLRKDLENTHPQTKE